MTDDPQGTRPDDQPDERSLTIPQQAARSAARPDADVPAPHKRRRPPAPPPEPIIVQKPRGCFSYLGQALLVLVVVFGVVFAVFALGLFDTLTDFGTDLRTFLGLEDATPEVVDTVVIVQGIRSMAVLQTTAGDLLIEKEVVEDQPLREDPYVRMRYVGRLTAGIDLSAIEQGDIVVNSPNSVSVTLPPAQLTGCYLENAQQLSASCGTTFFGLVSCTDKINELQRVAQNRAKRDLIAMADELGIIEQAYEAAEGAIGGLLTDLGFESIEFTRSTAEAPVDPSCEL